MPRLMTEHPSMGNSYQQHLLLEDLIGVELLPYGTSHPLLASFLHLVPYTIVMSPIRLMEKKPQPF